MWKRSKVTDQSAAGQTVDGSEGVHPDDKGIKKKSKVPGVMITQFKEELPEGMSTPDFTRKPIALTIQEGKFAIFKAKIVGNPTPTITWSRANGEIEFDGHTCMQKFDNASHEHTLEFPKVTPEAADTYKCYATNEYGRAVCTVVLNVIAVGFSKAKELQKVEVEDVADMRSRLKKRNPDGTRELKPMLLEEKIWEILLSADKKDYERICAEYGITDFRGMLKKLNDMKREREEEIAAFVSHITTLKHIEVKDNDVATIELDMDLKDPSSKIFLYKDGVMVPFAKEETDGVKHCLKQVGKKFVFTIKKLGKEDAGLYSVDVEGVNVFSTEFKVPDVDFAVKIREVKAQEREDAMFQCVLTSPLNEIKWFGKNAPLSKSEKHEFIVSDDKLIHKLIVRDCLPLDAGIYAAVAGIKSCNAWLVVEANKDPAHKGKKAARKTTVAGGGDDEDLLRIAKEQQERYLKEMEEKMALAKKAQSEQEAADALAWAEAEAATKAAAEAKAAAAAAAKVAKAEKAVAGMEAASADAAARKTKKAAAADGAGGAGAAGGAGHAAAGGAGHAAAGGAGHAAGHAAAGGAGHAAAGHAAAGGAADAGSAHGAGGDVTAGAGKGTGTGAGAGAGSGPGAGAGAGTGAGAGAGADASAGAGAGVGAGAGAGSGAGAGAGAGAAGAGAHSGAGVGAGAGEGGGAELGDDAEGEGEEGKSAKRVRDGPLVPDTMIGDKIDEDEETGNEEGDNSEKKGKRAKKKIVEGEEAVVGDKIDEDEETGNEEGDNSEKKGKRAKKKIVEGEEAVVGDKIDEDEETGNEEGEKSGKKGKRAKKKIVKGEEAVVGDKIDEDEESGNEEGEKSGKKGKRAKKKIMESEEAVVDPGVHFHAGLSDCKAIVGQPAELECKLSSEDCEGIWYKDGQEIKTSESITISKEGSFHRLKIQKVTEEDAGKYKFEADGRKTESLIVVEDPPRFDAADLDAFKTPITVKKGQKATFKLPYAGREPIKVQWFLEGEELSDETNIKIENSEGYSRLLLSKLQRKDSGEVKIKLKNEFGITEALSELIVLDKPTPPMGPLEIIEASASAVDFKWRPPKDSGGCKIINYILERNQVGRNTWKKLGPIGPENKYRDLDVDHGRRYCYRIRVETEMGISEQMETEDIQAGTKAYPGPPSAPKIVSAFKNCINLSWAPPSDTGGTNILGYHLEKRKKGSNLWSQVNQPNELIKGKAFAVKDVVEGIEYEFRVSAINNSGEGEFSTPSEFVFARDPKKPPGKVIDFKVTDSTYTTLSLSWTKPKDIEGVEDEAKGYFVEIRPAENTEWDRCNTNAITMTFYTVKGMKSMAMYWVRVIAVNDGGEGEPQELDNYILAMPPPVRPRFTDTKKIKSFMVVRAGNSARFNINFEASPWPEVTWLKDGVPVSKKVTISNAEGTSQLLIASSERSDTGIYTIIVKNIVGQETFSIEIRVTDEPKPPGPVELDENVPGTVTISWAPSPDEKRDDRLHYMVTKRDSSKRSWHTIADRIFNNKFTACNIMPDREYQFRVYAKNDMGSSDHSASPKWLITSKKEKFHVDMPESKVCDLQCAPKFLVPLKMHAAPQGYECYMSCAIKGDPTPHVTWLRNNISLNTNTNYYISNTCGVCSLLILRVGPKDVGEYKVVAENPLGRAECSTKLAVRE